MNKSKYNEEAASIEEYVSRQLTGKYLQAVGSIQGCGKDIAHHLRQLENRSREYHNPSFVVLVVGPVKSGKSTFVNLVAQSYVSPTHFLECTVRPSLIFAGQEERLTVYRSADAKHKEEQINSIIDSINGLGEEAAIANVRKEQYEHTAKNIDRYVKSGNVSVEADDILLTSIETHGGKLLQDHVYLVDMAGFDGDQANFDSPAYKAIIERADLIVFVQSSNSAISKVSASFFELLQKKNRSVPVCLVHNVFESAYWRDEATKQHDIEEQREYAVEQIKSRYGLVLDEGYAFNLNLGKVDDWRKGNFCPHMEEALKQEATRFGQAEAAMYELFRKRESIRLANCITRTSIQRDHLLDRIKIAVEQMQGLQARYEAVAKDFDTLKRERLGGSPTMLLSRQEMEMAVNEEYCATKELVGACGEGKAFCTRETRNYASRLMADISTHITRTLNSKRKECLAMRNVKEMQEWQVAVLQVAAQHLEHPTIDVDCSLEDACMELAAPLNVDECIPKKHLWNNYSADDVRNCLKLVKNKYCGHDIGNGVTSTGIIGEELLEKANALLKAAWTDVEGQLVNGMNSEIERLKQQALARIIPRHDQFLHDLALLGQLAKDVQTLNIHPHE
ncbi:MAG TPA: hypothetical protein DDW22_04675 [Prevotellaceae bacterium]|nr:hypothetical protein [Prevotellaceae bacterium]